MIRYFDLIHDKNHMKLYFLKEISSPRDILPPPHQSLHIRQGTTDESLSCSLKRFLYLQVYSERGYSNPSHRSHLFFNYLLSIYVIPFKRDWALLLLLLFIAVCVPRIRGKLRIWIPRINFILFHRNHFLIKKKTNKTPKDNRVHEETLTLTVK